MLDVLTLQIGEATLTGDIRRGLGQLTLPVPPLLGRSGTATFPLLEPCGKVLWKSAEVRRIVDPSLDSVRIRFGNGIQQFWLDPDGMTFEEVTDVSDWSTEYSAPSIMGALNLWTNPKLQLIIHLVSTTSDLAPVMGGVDVAMDLPAWEGAVSQALMRLAEAIAGLRPVLIHEEVLSEDTQAWNIGEPHSERGYELTDLIQVTINDVHKSASLSGGVVTLSGPAAPSGSKARIAVAFRPNTAVRRVQEVRFVNKIPAWLLSNLVTVGGLNGRMTPLDVSGFVLARRRVDVNMTVRGLAHRQVDALAMRAILQDGFSIGVQIGLDSGKAVLAHIDGLVEVLPQGGTGIPEAVGIVRMAITEAVSGRRVRNATKEVDDGQGGTKLVPLTNTITMVLQDAGLTVSVAADSSGDPSLTLTSEDC